jgi:hypothetical protein
MNKTEALRLADELEAPVGTQSTYSAMRQAAAELHRLHGLDFALRNCEQALKNMATKYMDTVDQRDALLEALKLAWPIIEAEMYRQNCSYGKNFSQTKVDRARAAHEKARAAIKAVEEGK